MSPPRGPSRTRPAGGARRTCGSTAWTSASGSSTACRRRRLEDRQAALSGALADELSAADGETLLLRLELPSDVPAASLFGRKDDRARTLRVTRGPVPGRGRDGRVLARARASRRCARCSCRCPRCSARWPGPAASTPCCSAPGPARRTPRVREALTLEQLGVRVRALPAHDALSVESASGFVSAGLERAATDAAARGGPLRVAGADVPGERAARGRPGGALLAGQRPRPPGAAGARGHGRGSGAAGARRMGGEGARRARGRSRDAEVLRLAGGGPPRHARSDHGGRGDRAARGRRRRPRPRRPSIPGITDSAHLSDWDPPFPVDLSRVGPRGRAYWEEHRTTPKAFLPLDAGRTLWKHRLGAATSVRVTAAAGARWKTRGDAFAAARCASASIRRRRASRSCRCARRRSRPRRARATSASTSSRSARSCWWRPCCSRGSFSASASSSARARWACCSRSAGRGRACGGCSMAEGLVLAAAGAVLGVLGALALRLARAPGAAHGVGRRGRACGRCSSHSRRARSPPAR